MTQESSDGTTKTSATGVSFSIEVSSEAVVIDRRQVYELLLAQHGPQNWWPGDSPFETMVGAVLTQGTAWTNAERAIDSLRAAGLLSPTRMRSERVETLAIHIRSSGYFRAKARKLQMLCAYFASRGDDVSQMHSVGPRLRAELEAVHGIGPETADVITLYVAGLPTFVVDAYSRRIFERLGEPSATASYSRFQDWLMEGVPADVELLGEYHALLVRHGQEVCTKRIPRCDLCALRSCCASALIPNYDHAR